MSAKSGVSSIQGVRDAVISRYYTYVYIRIHILLYIIKNNILQKRPIILRSLLIEATPYVLADTIHMCIHVLTYYYSYVFLFLYTYIHTITYVQNLV